MSLDRIELQALNGKRSLLSLFLVVLDWVMIALALYLAYKSTNYFIWWLCSLWIGFCLHRIALMGHDFSHFLVMPGVRGFDWLANILCFYPLGVTCAGYRKWHLGHHRHLNSIHDPELLVKGGRLYQKPLKKKMVVGLFFGDLIGFGIPEILKLQWVIRPFTWTDLLGLVAFWTSVAVLAIYYSFLPLLGLFLFSVMTSFWAAYRLRAITEHVGSMSTHRFKAPEVLKYFFFPYNTDHHFEHHEWPSIPWHNLPYARLKIKAPAVGSFKSLMNELAEKGQVLEASPNFIPENSVSAEPEIKQHKLKLIKPDASSSSDSSGRQ